MFLFYSDKSLVEHCTEVLDSARIVECIGRVSRRRFWLVQSSSQVMLEIGCVIQLFTLIALARAKKREPPYVILGGHYCSCRSFLELSKQYPELILCKHLLAVRLAPFFGKVDTDNIDDS
eukprot:18683-Heterococcus_DN1.PRE.1